MTEENRNTLGIVGIEIVRGCNFKCKMCPSVIVDGSSMKFMSRDTAKMVVSRINETDKIASIYAFGLGESLAHPDIYEIYKILNGIKRDESTPIVCNTNASCLTGEAAYAILEIPYITQLYISFDGYGDKESFDYLRGNHFHEVIDNVRNFMIMAKRKRPGLYVGTCSIYPDPKFIPNHQYVSRDDSEMALRSIFEPMGVHVAMRDLHKYNGFYTPELFKDISLPTQKVLGGCRSLEEHNFQIAWDGQIRPCCHVINEGFTIGNLYKQSFAEIIENESFLHLRHELRLDNRSAFPECENCGGSFGDDAEAAARYWKERIDLGCVSDQEELEYLGAIAKLGR